MRGAGVGSGVEEERTRGVDEEEMMEGGLKGRFSAGGEVYFSAKQRSFGSTSKSLSESEVWLTKKYLPV